MRTYVCVWYQFHELILQRTNWYSELQATNFFYKLQKKEGGGGREKETKTKESIKGGE